MLFRSILRREGGKGGVQARAHGRGDADVPRHGVERLQPVAGVEQDDLGSGVDQALAQQLAVGRHHDAPGRLGEDALRGGQQPDALDHLGIADVLDRAPGAPDGIERIATLATEINERVENIGARRLHTVLERLLEEISFTASDRPNTTVTIDAAYVDSKVAALAKSADLSRFIL